MSNYTADDARKNFDIGMTNPFYVKLVDHIKHESLTDDNTFYYVGTESVHRFREACDQLVEDGFKVDIIHYPDAFRNGEYPYRINISWKA